jgi:hypothetical protein
MIGQKQNLSSLLGITFEGGRMHVAQVRRVGDSFEVQRAFSAALSGSPVTSDPQTLGLEIRQVLLQQNIKENKCVVALPVQWMLSLATKIPDLSEADIPDFLNLEAERNFAYDPESLFASSSRCRFPSGEQYANIAGIQRDHILNLQSVLRAARLKPLSFTIGIAALQQMFIPPSAPVLILSLGQKELEVGITCGEGLYAMRSIENADGAEVQSFDADAVGRELRVTLGQIPPDIRARLVTARVFGSPDSAAKLRTDLAPRLRAMGIGAEPFNLTGDPAAAPNAVAVAAGYLLGKKSEFELLPPKISAWKEFAGKNSSRKLAWAASIAGILLLLVVTAFLVQGWQLSNLQNRWSVISPRVTELEDMQQQIKKFRPWFDNTFRSMTIFRKLTEAFPVDGVVTAKTLEIRNQSQVTCSGVARDNQVLFKMLDQLRSTKEVADVKMDQIHGKSPLQFSFNFRWVEGGTGEH